MMALECNYITKLPRRRRQNDGDASTNAAIGRSVVDIALTIIP